MKAAALVVAALSATATPPMAQVEPDLRLMIDEALDAAPEPPALETAPEAADPAAPVIVADPPIPEAAPDVAEPPPTQAAPDAVEPSPVQAAPATADPPPSRAEAAPAPELFDAAELDDLLAPVALYPDALLAQVLVASTFPLQIVQADRLLEESEAMSDDELTAAIETRDWDPSVLVLLAGFPDVIRRLADDLDDTERLGLAMAQQDADVLESVQRLRERAEETGYLADNEAQRVEREGERIVIEPADPEVVYVPRYDETLAFTSPVTAPPVIQAPAAGAGTGFGLDNPLVAGGIAFGSALLVNELFGDDESDGDKEGWDDYWRRDRRAIDWDERQVYPRAYGWDDDPERRRDVAWSRERDRYWDRQARRWRAEAEEARRERRETRAWEVRRDGGSARVRTGDWDQVRSAIERRESREARREQRRGEEARAAERRERERGEARAAERRDAARQEERRAADRDAERRRERRAEAERERERAARAAEDGERREREERAQQRQREERQAERRRLEQQQAERRRQEQAAQRQREQQRVEQRRRQEEAQQRGREQQVERPQRQQRAERPERERRESERREPQRQAEGRENRRNEGDRRRDRERRRCPEGQSDCR